VGDNSFKSDIRKHGTIGRFAWAQFTTASTSAPTSQDSEGVVTIARTGVGLFRITLPFACRKMQVILTAGGAAAAQTVDPVVRTISVTGPYVDIALVSKAAPADTETTGVTIYATLLLID
jgi:hypothetical protein